MSRSLRIFPHRGGERPRGYRRDRPGPAWHRRLIPAAGIACALFIHSAATDPGGPPLDLELILQQARRAQEEDVGAWKRFSFRRLALRERLNSEGTVVGREALEFVVTPGPGDFDERLVRLDGRSPTPGEVARHRRRALFNRHYNALASSDEVGGDDARYSLGYLLRFSSYRYAGREVVDGVPCHRLEFGPPRRDSVGGVTGRFVGAMVGTLWLTEDGLHIRRATARAVKPISVLFPLTRISEIAIDLQSHPVAPGVWLPQRLGVVTRLDVVNVPIRKRNVYAYSNFAPVRIEERPGEGREAPPPDPQFLRVKR